MKKEKVKFFVLILVVAFVCSAVVFLPAVALEKVDVADVLNRAYPTDGSREIKLVRWVEKWAIANYTEIAKSGDVWSGSVLLKENEGKWSVVSFCGEKATTDFLQQSLVPEKFWDKLLDVSWIKNTKPLLSALHNQLKPNYSFNCIRIVRGWALTEWSIMEGGQVEAEGQALLRFKDGRWQILESGGGAMDRSLLIQKGVPPELVKDLLGR